MKKLLPFLLALLIFLSFSATAETVREYVESQGYEILVSLDQKDHPISCNLCESTELQALEFSEDGQRHFIVSRPADDGFDVSKLRSLFYAIVEKYTWPLVYFYPNVDSGGNIDVIYDPNHIISNDHDYDNYSDFLKVLSSALDSTPAPCNIQVSSNAEDSPIIPVDLSESTLHTWAEQYTNCSPGDDTRDAGLIEYGLVFFLQPYRLEVGFGFEKEELSRLVYFKQGAYDSSNSTVSPLDFTSRFGMVGDILTELRTNEASYIGDLNRVFHRDSIDYEKMYSAVIALQTDDESLSYWFEYNLLTRSFKLWTCDSQ